VREKGLVKKVEKAEKKQLEIVFSFDQFPKNFVVTFGGEKNQTVRHLPNDIRSSHFILPSSKVKTSIRLSKTRLKERVA
jgi:hypothetical protein